MGLCIVFSGSHDSNPGADLPVYAAFTVGVGLPDLDAAAPAASRAYRPDPLALSYMKEI